MFRKKIKKIGIHESAIMSAETKVPVYVVRIPESTQTYARAANNKIYISTFGMFERSTNDLKKDIAEAPVGKKELS